MSNGAPPMLMSWCPGDKCDPCLPSGPVQIMGNYQGQNAWVVAYSIITHWPEFPISVSVTINFLGVADSVTSNILYSGSGSVTISGQSPNSLGVACPLAPTLFSLNVPAGWRPSGSQTLLFNVTGHSATTVGATLDTSTVDVLYFASTAVPVRWTGDVS